MPTKQSTELQDLVERPVERQGLELKSWVDLTDKSSPARAGIARHLAALTNFGGGYLVFGFHDDGTQCEAKVDVRRLYDHDVIGGIIDRYLQPKFQCEVYFEMREGVEHPIVWVPPHGTVPVISKADGPQGEHGQPQGIRAGLVYVRSPKPESVAISRPEQWHELIQRCVLSRRDELVKMFTEIVSSGSSPPREQQRTSERHKLEKYHQVTQQAFLDEFVRLSKVKTRFPTTKNFMQFSYMVRTLNDQQLPANRLMTTIEKANAAVRDTVRYGWSMFYPFTRPGIQARFMTDQRLDNGETEFVQCSLIEEGETDHLDFWRIATDGRVSIVRNFHEDRFSKRPQDVGVDQKWFDPWLHVRELTEIVRHARAISEEFTDIAEICFRCEWTGLKDRVTATLNWNCYWSSNASQVSSRVFTSCFPQAEVIGNLPAVVSALYAPVHRLFDPKFSPTPKWVDSYLQGFIVSGLRD